MNHWKTDFEYKVGRYPVLGLIDLFFLLLMIFVLSNSMLYIPGVEVRTDGGHVEQIQEDVPYGDGVAVRIQEDFSDYVLADKMVLTILETGELELNTRRITRQNLDNELEAEAGKLRRMYLNQNRQSQDEDISKYRPKLVINAAAETSFALLEDVINTVRNKKMDIVFRTYRRKH